MTTPHLLPSRNQDATSEGGPKVPSPAAGPPGDPETGSLTAEGRRRLAEIVPLPLNGFFDAEDVADLLAWLRGDAVMRGDSVW